MIIQVLLLLFSCIASLNAHEISIPAGFGINIHTSLRATKYYKHVVSQYDKYIHNALELSSKPRIPTIIHQIWLGSPLPEECQILQKTWFAHHPNWTYFLWTDTLPQTFAANVMVFKPRSFSDILTFLHDVAEKGGIFIIDIAGLAFSTRGHFDARSNYGEKSDILRYEILYHCGGLYIDTDFESLKPFDIFHHACDFYAGADYESPYFLVHNSIIGSRAKHPIIDGCMNAIRAQSKHQSSYTGTAVMMRTGPLQLAKHVAQHLSHSSDRTVIFPMTYFHPWPNEYRGANTRAEIEKWIRPESYGIHHWHVSWLH